MGCTYSLSFPQIALAKFVEVNTVTREWLGFTLAEYRQGRPYDNLSTSLAASFVYTVYQSLMHCHMESQIPAHSIAWSVCAHWPVRHRDGGQQHARSKLTCNYTHLHLIYPFHQAEREEVADIGCAVLGCMRLAWRASRTRLAEACTEQQVMR